MSIPYESSTQLDTPMPDGSSYIEFPFLSLGDNTTKIYHLECVVKEEDYTPLVLNTAMTDATTAGVTSLPFSADANAFHVGDYNHSITDGIFRRFDRRFAQIPQSNAIPSGTEIYTFPGMIAAATTTPTLNISNISTGTNDFADQTITTSADHNLSVGDLTKISAQFIYTVNTYNYTYNVFRFARVETVPTTTTFTTRMLAIGTYQSGGIVYPRATRGRRQVSRSSTTQIVRDYFLPGVTTDVSQIQDIELQQQFRPYYFAEGNDVDTLSAATTPTNDEYNTLINNNGFVIMSEDIKKWMGNIYVKESKQIRAM